MIDINWKLGYQVVLNACLFLKYLSELSLLFDTLSIQIQMLMNQEKVNIDVVNRGSTHGRVDTTKMVIR